MRQSIVLAVLLVTAAWPMPAAAESPTVVISELLPDPQGQREFVEVWNAGSSPVTLRNWTIADQAGNAYTFADHALPGGGRIVLWGGGAADARGPAWSRASVWNNGGDQVILKDASGSVVDVFAYGSASWPDGRTDQVPAAPPTNRSLSLIEGLWSETSPTPGSRPNAGSGQATATVQDVAPTISIDAPQSVPQGTAFDVLVHVDDGNGADDVAAWNLTAGGILLANGTAAGTHFVQAAAPSDRDAWTLVLTASDMAGNVAVTSHDVTIRLAGLVIVMPELGLSFPAFPPGAAEVITNTSFVLRNEGTDTITPRIDISDLTGPVTIPVAGRLDIGNHTWTPYDGPLTALPVLAPGEVVELRLRLRDVPAPLPAGTYGTSFTVIA